MHRITLILLILFEKTPAEGQLVPNPMSWVDVDSKEMRCLDTRRLYLQNEFYSNFDLIYMYNEGTNIKFVRCSCEEKVCVPRTCNSNLLSSCLFNNRTMENINILGKKVDVFTHTFRWENNNETWQLCNDSNPFVNTKIERPIIFTAYGFYAKLVVLNDNVIIERCIPSQDFHLLRKTYRLRHEVYNETDITSTFGDYPDSSPSWMAYNYWSHAIAIPFIIITIVVYASLPRLRDIHGISLVCLLITILACNILLMSAYSTDYNRIEICNVMSYLSFWSYMAKELWMFVIGFDLWMTFCVRILPRSKSTSKTVKTLLTYSLFAWGTSFLVTVILWILYSKPYSIEEILSSNCNQRNCCYAKLYFLENITKYTYVESVFATVNVVFLAFTFKKILRTQFKQPTERPVEKIIGQQLTEQRIPIEQSSEQPIAIKNRSRGQRIFRSVGDRQKTVDFCLFVRLFVLMQAAWIFSKITQHIQEATALPESYINLAWKIDVTLQSAHGIMIFFVFAFKRETRNDFWERIKITWVRSNTRDITGNSATAPSTRILATTPSTTETS